MGNKQVNGQPRPSASVILPPSHSLSQKVTSPTNQPIKNLCQGIAEYANQQNIQDNSKISPSPGSSVSYPDLNSYDPAQKIQENREEVKFPVAQPQNYVRRWITYQSEDLPILFTLRTKYDTFKIPVTVKLYLTKLGLSEDLSELDIDFPSLLDIFLYWTVFKGEQSIVDWVSDKPFSQCLVFRYFAYELGAKDCAQLESFILSKLKDYEVMVQSIICHHRYLNFEFLKSVLQSGIDSSIGIKIALAWLGEKDYKNPQVLRPSRKFSQLRSLLSNVNLLPNEMQEFATLAEEFPLAFEAIDFKNALEACGMKKKQESRGLNYETSSGLIHDQQLDRTQKDLKDSEQIAKTNKSTQSPEIIETSDEDSKKVMNLQTVFISGEFLVNSTAGIRSEVTTARDHTGPFKVQSILMNQKFKYKGKSLEELRLADYMHGGAKANQAPMTEFSLGTGPAQPSSLIDPSRPVSASLFGQFGQIPSFQGSWFTSSSPQKAEQKPGNSSLFPTQPVNPLFAGSSSTLFHTPPVNPAFPVSSSTARSFSQAVQKPSASPKFPTPNPFNPQGVFPFGSTGSGFPGAGWNPPKPFRPNSNHPFASKSSAPTGSSDPSGPQSLFGLQYSLFPSQNITQPKPTTSSTEEESSDNKKEQSIDGTFHPAGLTKISTKDNETDAGKQKKEDDNNATESETSQKNNSSTDVISIKTDSVEQTSALLSKLEKVSTVLSGNLETLAQTNQIFAPDKKELNAFFPQKQIPGGFPAKPSWGFQNPTVVSFNAFYAAAQLKDTPKEAAKTHEGPRCKDGSLDMQYAFNRGRDKYTGELINSDDRPRCVDGSLDMRFAVNKGLDKYTELPTGFNAAQKQESTSVSKSSGANSTPHDGPRCKDGSLDMRYSVNKGYDKYTGQPLSNPIAQSSSTSTGCRTRHDGPRCKDGSLDMRYAVNRGMDKYRD